MKGELIKNTDLTHLDLFEWTERIALNLQEAGVSRLVYHKDTTSEEAIVFVKEFFGYLNLGLKDFSRSVIFKKELDTECLRIILGKLIEFYGSPKAALKGIDLMEDCYRSFYDCFKTGVTEIGYKELLPEIETQYKMIMGIIDDAKEEIINTFVTEL